MKPNRSRLRAASPYLLILGLLFFVLGLITNQEAFTWAAIIFLLLSLIAGGRWLRRR